MGAGQTREDAERNRPSPSGSKESNNGEKLDFSAFEVLSAYLVFCTKCVGVLRMYWRDGEILSGKGLMQQL